VQRLLALILVATQASPVLAGLDRAMLVKLSSSVLKVEVLRAERGYSLGSGVVVGSERVVTNCHVTRDARQIRVLQGGLRLPAQLQQVDAYHDLCFLRVRGIESARAVRLGLAGELSIGQPVTAVGHTAGAFHSSAGAVLALHRMDGARVIQSSNFFSSGASGGGLFDAEGKLVGVLSFRLRGATGHYFAMPAEWLQRQVKADAGQRIGRNYLRLRVRDRPGVLAEITAAMRDAGVSIESLIQRSAVEDEGVLVAIVTHAGAQSRIDDTFRRLAGSDSLLDDPMVMHILDLTITSLAIILF